MSESPFPFGNSDTARGYNCWRCGGFVPDGCTHSCPTGIYPTQFTVGPPVPTPVDEWVPTLERATPLYIGPLPHYARRMLQALDAYWLHCDGLPKGRHPRSRSTAEDWWTRFEKYRAKVEGQL